jgi:hypothetical protein
MSVPWIIVGMGAVGGLYLAKAGPFRPHPEATKGTPTDASAPANPTNPGTTAGAVPAQGVMTAPGPDVVAGNTGIVNTALMDAPQANNPTTVGGVVANDGLGIVQPPNATDGTGSGGVVGTKYAPSISDSEPLPSNPRPEPLPVPTLTEAVMGSPTGLTPRDEMQVMKQWGPTAGVLW